jgi:hypothetical protein
METQNSINELIYLIAFTKLKGISDIEKSTLFQNMLYNLFLFLIKITHKN